MFQSILCPVDFSRESGRALRYAVAIGRHFGGRVTVLFVTDPLLLAAANAAYSGRRRFVDRSNVELARFVKKTMLRDPTPEENISHVVSVGSPAEQILQRAKKLRSDLIVMGSHGLSGVRKAFFGSTTEQVLRRANIPVLAIPFATGSSRSSDWMLEITRVVAPIDLTGEWQSDVARAAAIAESLRARLLLVHVLAAVQTPPWLGFNRAVRERRVARASAALKRVANALDVPAVPSTIVAVGDPADEIARIAKRGSLVVMSLRGTKGIFGLRRGAVAYRVLTHASTPVLALPRRSLQRGFTSLSKTVETVLNDRDRTELAGLDALLAASSSDDGVKQ